MALASVQQDVERESIRLIENVRQQIVLAVVAGDVGDHSSLRYTVRDIIHNNMDYIATNFWRYYEQAWDAGIQRGGKLGLGGSTITRQLSRFEDITTQSFKSLTQSMDSEVSTLLSRAALGALTKEEVLSRIGSERNSGLFKNYQSRALGILDYETFQIEGYAARLRATEVAQQGAKEAAAAKTSRAKGQAKGSESVMLFITVWRHSNGGNPPRANHVAMDGVGVITGTDFALETRNDGTVMCQGPHAANLSAAETINCKCVAIQKAFKVTAEQKAKIEQESAGGMRSELWS